MFRHLRWISGLCFGVVLVTSSVQAQTPRLSPKEIGQIIDVALHAVIPPEERLTTATVAERGIRFDYGRTMAAFKSADNADARASLGLTRAVTEGSAALLEDCDLHGTKKCSRLGQSAYVSVKPISVSNSEAAVWVNVVYATTMSNGTYRSSMGCEVFLRRSGSGPWTFVDTGNCMRS
jgi:hypothetical protein